MADNSVVTYGPDAEGYIYEITHSRELNWSMSHDCQATVRRGMEKGMAEDLARVQVPTKAKPLELRIACAACLCYCALAMILCIGYAA